MWFRALARVVGRQFATRGSVIQIVAVMAIGVPVILALDRTPLHPLVWVIVKVAFWAGVVKLTWDGRLMGWLRLR